MRSRILYLAFSILALIPGVSSAEKVWTSFISSDAVYDIAVQGDNIWCATANGPVRWDSKTLMYTLYNSIPDNRTNCVEIDRSGNIWFGTKNGIFRLDPKTGIFSDMSNNMAYRRVAYMEIDADDVVRLTATTQAGYGSWYYVLNGSTWKEYTPPALQRPNGVQTLVTDPDDISWKASSTGIIRTDNNGVQRMLTTANRLPDTAQISLLATDPEGMLWLPIQNGVAFFDGVSWNVRSMPEDFGSPGIGSIQIDRTGIVWLLTRKGIVRYDGAAWTLFEDPGGIPSSDLTHLVVGHDGSIWTGSTVNISRYDNGVWKPYPVNPQLGELGLGIQTLTIGKGGVPIIGTIPPLKPDKYYWTAPFSYYLIYPDSIVINDSGFTSSEVEHIMHPACLLCAESDSVMWSQIRIDARESNTPRNYTNVFRIRDREQQLVFKLRGERFPSGFSFAPDGSIWASLGINYGFGYEQQGELIHYVLDTNGNYMEFKMTGGLYSDDIKASTVGSDGTVWAGGVYHFSGGSVNSLTRYGEPLSDETVITSVSDAAPAPITLLCNHPNPFNPSTTISYTLPESGKANLTVYDITGRKVRTLVSQRMSAGSHSIVWDGRDDSGRAVSSGVYLARLTAGKYSASGKMLLMK